MKVKQTDGQQVAVTGLHVSPLVDITKHHKASGSRIPEPAVVMLNLKVSQCRDALGSSPADRSDAVKPAGCRRFRRRSLWDGRRPVHVHRLTEREDTEDRRFSTNSSRTTRFTSKAGGSDPSSPPRPAPGCPCPSSAAHTCWVWCVRSLRGQTP